MQVVDCIQNGFGKSWQLEKWKKLQDTIKVAPISSLQVPESSFHVGYKWVVAYVSIITHKFGGEIPILCQDRDPSTIFVLHSSFTQE